MLNSVMIHKIKYIMVQTSFDVMYIVYVLMNSAFNILKIILKNNYFGGFHEILLHNYFILTKIAHKNGSEM